MTDKNDQYIPEEAARRRDGVIRRMANHAAATAR